MKWYKFYSGECPVCGRRKSYKELQHGDKPLDPNKRYIRLSDSACYDWCDVL